MKQIVGPLIATPHGSAALPQQLRVYRTLRDAIVGGRLLAGQRLPSARQLAADWGVARTAVDAACEQLQNEGLVQRRVGDGSYVADPLPAALRRPAAEPLLRPLSRSAQQVLERFAPYVGKQSTKQYLMQDAMRPRPLFPRTPFADDFPLPLWRRLLAEAYADGQRETLHYGAAAGHPALRAAVARHLALTRATPCSAEQVLIVNSPMQGLELISRVLLEPGDKVWIEDPGFASVPALIRVLHQQPVPVPLDEQGLVVEAGCRAAPDAAAVYFHPMLQFPTGWRTREARLRQLLDWADDAGAWIVEGNFNDEVAHDRHMPPTLRLLDRSERVLIMGTFEGIFFPSLRVAYLVVPERLMHVFVAMRGLMGDHTAVATQLACARFLDDGAMHARLRALRKRVQARSSLFAQAVARELPPWVRCGPLNGDGHACLHWPASVPDREVSARWREAGVSSFALSTTTLQHWGLNGAAMAYAPFSAREVEDALASLGRVLRGFDPPAAAPSMA